MTASISLRTPAYRIETDRLLLRCFRPADAPAFRALLDRNDDYLRPWIPWMKDEPMSLADTAQRLRTFRANFDLDVEFRYAVFERNGNGNGEHMVGLTGLHTRAGPGALEIGYMVDRDMAGSGYATEMSAALLRVAFEIARVTRVEVVCAKDNVPSQRVPARLGFAVDGKQQRRGENSEGRMDDLVVWIMDAGEYAGCAAAGAPIRAYDCLDSRMI